MLTRCWSRTLAKLAVIATALTGLLLLDRTAPAATKPDPHAAQVQKTLADEAGGSSIARDKQLETLIESAPDYAQARWAAGFVQREGKWVKFDSLPEDDAQNEKLADYRLLRDNAADTAEGHLKLANWCHQHGLKDQERAHLLRVLHFEPNRTDLRQRLGMVYLGGVWMLPGEARQAAARGKQAVTDLKHWSPKVERFRAALAGPPGRLRDLAGEHVRAIRDPSAILALETVLAPSSDDGGLAVIDALAAMKRPEAAVALARIATFSESSDTRDAAREKLKPLPMEHFVPAMLASLVVPGNVQTRFVQNRGARLLFEQSFVFEGADRKVVTVFQDAYRAGHSGLATYTLLAATEMGALSAAGRTLATDAQNRQIERTNARIVDTLREVSGQTLSANPKAWWEWWNEVNEIIVEGEKQTEVTFVQRETRLVSPETQRYSCLIAGTPIWTDRGPAAIETMKVGDRVLAQDPISGELAYRPVLRTTIRPRAPLIHITFPDEQIVASGGHPFWVAGQGWVNARQLKPDMLIHTATGTVPITKIETDEDASQPVYNLEVEDFHDYFAGNAHLLLHDTTPREPTLGPAPGWQE